ncbi:TraB/GumN family protein [Dysgonomonas macrotermitis]|uniref:TraB family protein n=1 Tax=Dysgonomonas macrotermitis TaxID=1346286 RepID=A0A1M5CAU6_9BACT|nr:TraB/GumN family protein [Dysgonomonas macrotermitis]SHF51542.1 hypothetical protein SAMN05444362_10788 [Dysgonomonas macrotermitis]
MSHIRLSILFIYFICSSLFAVNAQKAEFTGSVLWKISGKDLPGPSYIVGTNHIISDSFLDSIPGLKEAMNSTGQVIGEMDMDNVKADMAAMATASIIPDGKTYSELLTEERYQLLDSVLRNDLGIALSQVEMISPVTLSNLYVINVYNKVSPKNKDSENMDTYFQTYAREKGKPVLALETLEEQIRYLYYLKPLDKQIEELFCTITSDHLESDILELDSLYRKGDLTGLEQLMDREDLSCPGDPEEKDILYLQRNNNWLEKLPAIMKSETSLIAVGCLHLAGEDGLLNRLSEMGYEVTPVK